MSVGATVGKQLIILAAGFDITETHGATVKVLDAPLLEISSTHIRELIKNKKSVKFLVPDIVKEEIELAGYYRT